MDIQTDFSDYGLSYFRVADIKGTEQVVITSSAKVEVNQWGKKRITFNVMHQGVAKKMSLASPQVQQIVGLWGGNSLGWIGKSVNVTRKPVKLRTGETMETMYFTGLNS